MTMHRPDLVDTLDGLHAYDNGAVDSGIHDETLRARCIAELKRHAAGPDGGRVFFTELIRDMWFTETAISLGYGVEDALGFVDWLEERMGVRLR